MTAGVWLLFAGAIVVCRCMISLLCCQICHQYRPLCCSLQASLGHCHRLSVVAAGRPLIGLTLINAQQQLHFKLVLLSRMHIHGCCDARPAAHRPARQLCVSVRSPCAGTACTLLCSATFMELHAVLDNNKKQKRHHTHGHQLLSRPQ